jgi:hypothetical protein
MSAKQGGIMTPDILIANIISYYGQYIEALEEGETPVTLETFVNSICAQFNESLDDEVECFIDNQ